LLSLTEVESLRELLIYARDRLKLTRMSIAETAKVNPIDIDNFVTRRRKESGDERKINKSPFKTRIPNVIFQKRIINFIINEREFLNILRNPSHEQFINIKRINEIKAKILTYSEDDDLFSYLNSIYALDDSKALQLSKDLSGNFYIYRLSAQGHDVFKSHMEISGTDAYNKTPSFVYRRRGIDGNVQVAKGFILKLEDEYIFIGFFMGSDEKKVGLKMLILNRDGQKGVERLSGFCASYYSGGRYEVGTVKMVRTSEKYDISKIQTLESASSVLFADEINNKVGEKLGFPLAELMLSLGGLEKEIKIPNSIEFNFRNKKL